MTDVSRLRAAIDAIKDGTGDRATAAEQFGRAFNLRPAKRQRICLAVLAGQRCEKFRHGNPSCPGCDDSLMLDHGELWARDDEQRASVLTAQTYGLPGSARDIAERFGLSLLVDSDLSWHAPGSTTLLVFDRRREISNDLDS